MAIVTIWILDEVLLMIILGIIKALRLSDFCCNGAIALGADRGLIELATGESCGLLRLAMRVNS